MSEIDYSIIDQVSVRTELENLLRKTDTFANADFKGTNISTFVNLLSYNAELFGYYINQIANEPFIDSAKLYKNLNRIANSLGYNPVGSSSAKVEVVAKLSNDYVLSNREGYIEIPAYSSVTSTKGTSTGATIKFINEKPLLVQIRQFGTHPANYTDFIYNGRIGTDGVLNPNKFYLNLTELTNGYIIQNSTISSVLTSPIFSTLNNNVSEFKTNNEYSLLLQLINNEWVFLISQPTTTSVTSEVCKFKIDDFGTIVITRNTSSGLLSIGKLGFRNLEYVKFVGDPTTNNPNILLKLKMVIPRYSPTVQIMYNDEILSFSTYGEDIIVSTDNIPSNFFKSGETVYVVLELMDRNALNYGAKLTLKKYDALSATDVYIAILPVDKDTFNEVSNGVGDFKLLRNTYAQQAETKKLLIKTGQVTADEGETQKRVSFDVPFDFNLSSSIITSDSLQDYSIILSPDGNVITYFAEKTINGFIINIEPNSGYSGIITWRAVAYEKDIVQQQEVNISKLDYLINVDAGYSVIIQPNTNANVWVSDIGNTGFKIVSDSTFNGEVDYLIIPNDTTKIESSQFQDTGSQYVALNETIIQVTFAKQRLTNTYRVFLQPDNVVKCWVENKTTNGFTIRIPESSQYSGRINWQLHDDTLSNTIVPVLTNLYGDYYIKKSFVDIEEKQSLGFFIQGIPNISLINPNGLIEGAVNSLALDYDTDLTTNVGLSYIITNSQISYNNIRVLVKIGGIWTEFTEVKNYEGIIDENSKIFYVRVNKDKLVGISFGNNNSFGYGPNDNKIAIIGLQTVGSEGNIGDGVLSSVLDPTLVFNSSAINANLIEMALFQELKLINDNGTPVGRSLLDSKGLPVNTNNFVAVQIGSAILGTDPETAESLRKNANSMQLSQNRLVSNQDYKNKIKANFSNFIVDVEVYNYIQAINSGLIDNIDTSKYFFNSLFLMMIPLFGKTFTINQKNLIKDYLSQDFRKLSTMDFIIVEPKFISIDVLVAYKTKLNYSPIEVNNEIVSSVNSYFNRSKHILGETISVYDIQNSIMSNGLKNIEISIRKDADNTLQSDDYAVSIDPSQYQDKYADVQAKKLNEALSAEIKNMIAKGIITLNAPLLDVVQTDGTKTYPYGQDITLGKFEFPILGDLIIERKN